MLYSCPGNFYPRSPCGERPGKVNSVLPGFVFLSTLSLRRATEDIGNNVKNVFISIHALLAESDLRYVIQTAGIWNFYPRSPCGERPSRKRAPAYSAKFLSTLSLRRATYTEADIQDRIAISIHALLAESDKQILRCGMNGQYFYPRSPCGERRGGAIVPPLSFFISIHALLAESDDSGDETPLYYWQFLSTLSLRRATGPDYLDRVMLIFLSTLSLRRATNWHTLHSCRIGISIHALLAESDVMVCRQIILFEFLSTLSLRRATAAVLDDGAYMPISIHALLAESDLPTVRSRQKYPYFYPRSPCGERPTTPLNIDGGY